jgi:hypothetical protein
LPAVDAAPAPAAANPWDAISAVEEPKAVADEKPGYGTSLARGAVQSLTMGLADKSFGLTRGDASMLRGEGFQKGYDEGVTRYIGAGTRRRRKRTVATNTGPWPTGLEQAAINLRGAQR